jgi:ribosomal protein L37AE/L43A
MLEVTPDVLTCQGKNLLTKSGTDFELENMWNQFAEAMSDIADVQTQKMGAQPRDTQWNMPSRNSLDKVKSLEGLMEFTDELSRNRTSVLEYAKSAYLEILFASGWTLEDAKIYCEQGGLTILVTRTYDNFYSLLQQVIGKSFKNPKQWDDIGQQHIDHHVKQLAQIRTFSNRREIMLYRKYAYLRDGQAVGFQDSKLVSKLMEKLMDAMYCPNGETKKKKAEEVPKRWSCTHCHEDFHDGGSAQCDLKDENTRVARTMAKKIDRRLANGETDKAAILQEIRTAG